MEVVRGQGGGTEEVDRTGVIGRAHEQTIRHSAKLTNGFQLFDDKYRRA